jgi:flagellar basal-body rod protein FlgB
LIIGGLVVNIFPQSFQSLEQALTTSTLKQRVHSANIANVDTPNYKTRQVSFQESLNDALTKQSISSYKTNSKHFSFSNETTQNTPNLKVNNTTAYKPNGNNVDMDLEMAELAKNQLWFNALTERVNGKFNTLRTVINEGR